MIIGNDHWTGLIFSFVSHKTLGFDLVFLLLIAFSLFKCAFLLILDILIG